MSLQFYNSSEITCKRYKTLVLQCDGGNFNTISLLNFSATKSTNSNQKVPITDHFYCMHFFYWQDVLYTALVVLAFLFTFCGNAESKPTISTLQDQPNSKVTKESIESHDTNQDTAGMMAHSAGYKDDAVIQSTEHGRLKRETLTLPNPCVAGYKLKLIDRERVVLTVSCAQGCKEIKRVFFLPDREDPLTFVVDCKK